MARKNAKISSKKCINDGDVSGGGSKSSDTANADVSPPSPPPLSTEKGLIENFYEKLVRLHQSSGLSLAFNFQESKVDLYLLYKKVTENGGFHQVTKEGKWNEVENAVNLKMQVSLLPSQVLQKLYEILLLQYEQMHYYRTPAKSYTRTTATGNQPKPLLGKRKSCENSSHEHQHHQVAAEEKRNVQIHFDDDKDIKDLQLPIKPRTAYQMFVKIECDRLKKLHETGFRNISYRNMATESWKHLSQSERVPYIEASKKDKARFYRDMDVYEQIWNQNLAKEQKLLSDSSTSIINFGSALLPPDDDGYFETLEEADSENFSVPDESLVENTVQILKGSGSNDSIFQIN